MALCKTDKDSERSAAIAELIADELDAARAQGQAGPLTLLADERSVQETPARLAWLFTPFLQQLYERRLWPEIAQLYRANGCAACSNTGYRGRIGMYEVMPMSEEIERMTVERASSDAIKSVAIQQGMMPLRDDGLEKTRMGITSIEEVARVVK